MTRGLALDVKSSVVWGGLMRSYRYVLRRQWNARPGVCWIMLNPSTADENTDDPTVMKCQTYARLWDYGSITVVNLFAFRATNPRILPSVQDPIGPENDTHIEREAARAALVVCAWGNHAKLNMRSTAVRGMLSGIPLHALRVTKANEPEHPLYLPLNLKPEVWNA